MQRSYENCKYGEATTNKAGNAPCCKERVFYLNTLANHAFISLLSCWLSILSYIGHDSGEERQHTIEEVYTCDLQSKFWIRI